MSFAWKGFHSFGGGFSPSFGPSLTGGITPIGSWDASTSTLAQLAALVSHSRTSLATMFDSTGKLTYAPNNLLTQSNTFSDAAWTKDTAGTGVAPTLTDSYTTAPDGSPATRFVASLGATPATALSRIYQLNLAPASASVSTFGIWAKTNDASTQTVYISGSNAGADFSTITVTPSWQFFSTYIVKSGAAFFQIGISGASWTGLTTSTSIDMSIAEAVSSAVTYETTPRAGDKVITTSAAYYGPRVDYDPNTLAVKGLLIEEARTNLAINSANFSSGYTVNAIARSTDATLASDGVTLAAKYTASAGTVSPLFYSTVAVTVSAATNYAVSIETDGRSGAYPVLNFATGSGNYAVAVFDITTGANGAATQTAATGATVVSTNQVYLGGGRYRLTLVASVNAGTTGYFQPGLTKATTGNTFSSWGVVTNSTFAGSEYVYFAFGQFEAGSASSSTIITGASSVTRAEERVQLTGAALAALQGASGTAIVEQQVPAVTSTILLGSLAIAYMYINGAGNVGSYDPSASPTAVTAFTGGTNFGAGVTRTGLKWTSTSRSVVMNGGTVVTVPGGFVSSRAAAQLASYAAVGGSHASGWYRSIGLYTSALPDATLQQKSVVGASY